MAVRNDQGVYLTQVYPTEAHVDTDIDIIAIHGLDTKSPQTWTWKNKDGSSVNWLEDKHMLPSVARRARIFTCDWPSSFWQPTNMRQLTLDELAILLFQGIKSRPPVANENLEKRPILFIASCLGGILLIKSLVDTGRTYDSIRKAARGILFLATPFQGTSLAMVVSWARVILEAKAARRRQQVSNLLDILGGPTFKLGLLARKFTALYSQDPDFQLFNFYETKPTSLPRKVIPWLPESMAQEIPLVNEESATLHMVPDPLPLTRNHVLMNKFSGPECIDYKLVSGKIRVMLQNIRNGVPINQADTWIRNEYYNATRLSLERLSGDLLPIDQQYISLNLWIRDGAGQIDLQTLFDPRSGPDGQANCSRRTLLQGGPGTGKTTLCKRILHEFKNGLWGDLFSRILWVPLRRFKTWSATAECTAGEFFRQEYFFECRQSASLATELWRSVEGSDGERTLFLFDGLDEVVRDIPSESDAYRLLKYLLNQSNVIITSRTSELPYGVRPVDIALETVPFNPDQVAEYVAKTGRAAADMQSFLDQHPDVADFVRAPAHLDAFCHVWEPGQTTTGLFEDMELCLWKKDILRLNKDINGHPLTLSLIEDASLPQVEDLAGNEVALVLGLAFTGLCNGVADFAPRHQKTVATYFRASRSMLLPGMVLPRLSFLRAVDPAAKTYRFVHPVLRDYLAARYFVQRQTAEEPLILLDADHRPITADVATFLQANREKPHYEIFWRFVAGLQQEQGQPPFQPKQKAIPRYGETRGESSRYSSRRM